MAPTVGHTEYNVIIWRGIQVKNVVFLIKIFHFRLEFRLESYRPSSLARAARAAAANVVGSDISTPCWSPQVALSPLPHRGGSLPESASHPPSLTSAPAPFA